MVISGGHSERIRELPAMRPVPVQLRIVGPSHLMQPPCRPPRLADSVRLMAETDRPLGGWSPRVPVGIHVILPVRVPEDHTLSLRPALDGLGRRWLGAGAELGSVEHDLSTRRTGVALAPNDDPQFMRPRSQATASPRYSAMTGLRAPQVQTA